MTRLYRHVFWMLVLTVATTPWAFGADDLTSELPATANAAAVVDVKALLESKLGQQEKWQSKLIDDYTNRPLAVPAYADTVAAAASLSTADLSPAWQVSLTRLNGQVNLERLIKEQNGVPDEIAGRPAVKTRYGMYHIALRENVVGTAWPGDRQRVVALLASSPQERGVRGYLAQTLESGDHAVILAVDLMNAFGPRSVQAAMADGGLQSLDEYQDDLGSLTRSLASISGVNLKVDAGAELKAVLTADFANAPKLTPELAKALAIEVVREAGLPTEDLSSWSFEVKKNQIVGSGQITPAALSSYLQLFAPPSQHLASELARAPVAGDAPAPELTAAAASQQYYRALSRVLDNLRSGATPMQNASYLRSQARMIQQLPILNVDPELVAWGGEVADALQQAALILAGAQQQAMIASESVVVPAAGSATSYYGESAVDSAEDRAAFRNLQRERRAAAMAQRAAASEPAVGLILEVSKTRNEIRSRMTQKYGVEF